MIFIKMNCKNIIFCLLLLITNVIGFTFIGTSFLVGAANYDLPQNKYAEKPMFYDVSPDIAHYFYIILISVIFSFLAYTLFLAFKKDTTARGFIKVFCIQFTLFVLVSVFVKIYLILRFG